MTIRMFTNEEEDEEKEERSRKSLLWVSGKDIFSASQGREKGAERFWLRKNRK